MVGSFIYRVELYKIVHIMITDLFENRRNNADSTTLAATAQRIHVQLNKWLATLPGKLFVRHPRGFLSLLDMENPHAVCHFAEAVAKTLFMSLPVNKHPSYPSIVVEPMDKWPSSSLCPSSAVSPEAPFMKY